MVRVLIVDDSPTGQLLVKSILESDSEIEVIDADVSSRDVIQQMPTLKPDVVVMDVSTPSDDGFEDIKGIMEQYPVPIIALSSFIDSLEFDYTQSAFFAGALDVFEKPPDPQHPEFDSIKKQLVDSVKFLAEVKVIPFHALEPQPTPISAKSGEGNKGKLILVVEDSKTYSTLFRVLLVNAGHQVLMASNGQEGWMILQGSDVDLVISDVLMPGMNGFTFTRMIKRHERTRDIPVVILSSQDWEEDEERGREAGAAAYIMKSSFEDVKLVETVESLL